MVRQVLRSVAFCTLILGAAALRPSEMDTEAHKLTPEHHGSAKKSSDSRLEVATGAKSGSTTTKVDPKVLLAALNNQFFAQKVDSTGKIALTFFNSNPLYALQHLRNAIDLLLKKDDFSTEDGLGAEDKRLIQAIKALLKSVKECFGFLDTPMQQLAELAQTTADDVPATLLTKLKQGLDQIGARFQMSAAATGGNFLTPLWSILEQVKSDKLTLPGVMEENEIPLQEQVEGGFMGNLLYVVQVEDEHTTKPSPFITMALDNFQAVFAVVPAWRSPDQLYFADLIPGPPTIDTEPSEDIPVNVAEQAVQDWDTRTMSAAEKTYPYPRVDAAP